MWTVLVDCLSSPASEESTSPSIRGCGLTFIANATDMLKAFSCPGCGAEIYLEPQSGMTSAHLERSNLEPAPILFSAGSRSHARISALRELALAWTESEAGFFSKSLDLLLNAIRPFSSSKTCPPFAQEVETEWGKNWPASGMIVDGRLSQLPTWEQTIDEPAGSCLLPTPSASSYGTNQGGAAGRTGKARPSLETMAKKNLWPTPTAQDAKNDGGPAQGDRNSPPLNLAVKMWSTPVADDCVDREKGKWNSRGEPKLSAEVKLWPSPRASDGAKGGPNQRGSKGDLALPAAVHQWSTPCARDSGSLKKVMRGAGSKAKGNEIIQPLPVQAGGSLNPAWVEWLMGYSSGWTELGALETEWFRSKSKQRSVT